MAIPWLPKETSSRLHEKPHELENVKATYLTSCAFVAGFLGREDGKRPAWFPRVRLLPVSKLSADMQEHLASACHVICMKTRQEVTSDPMAKPATKLRSSTSARPQTSWQAGVLCTRVLWRTLFAATAAKAPVTQCAAPVLFMAACESLKHACRQLLTKVWLEVQLQFTAKVNKYRNMKSRPPWKALEVLQFEVFGEGHGFGLHDPSTAPPTAAGTAPAANLQAFLEEALALRFAIDALTACQQDAQDFIDQSSKRGVRQSAMPRGKINPAEYALQQQLATLKEKTVNSFAMMWTDDAELRGVASLASRMVDSLEGANALEFAATCAGQMMLAAWKGVEPMLEHLAKAGVAKVAESHSMSGYLPPPSLPEVDSEMSHSTNFDLIANSYAPPSQDVKDLCDALPRGVMGSIVKVQATFRAYLYRSRHFGRSRSIAAYCKAARWPRSKAADEWDDEDDVAMPLGLKSKKTKKQATAVDAAKLNESIADFTPSVSKYLGGDARTQGPEATLRASPSPKGTMGSSMRSLQATTSDFGHGERERRAWPLPTADHRACADLFVLYAYNMYRRRDITRMWQTLCGGYERSMDTYAELLKRNPALKPMLESISAQLKRGAVVGYDKAFIAKHTGGDDAGSAKGRTADADLFKRKPKQAAFDSTFASVEDSAMQSLPQQPSMMSEASMLISPEKSKDDGIQITGDYLTKYLKEMDGDDSQFKDISPAVAPLSTGTSPGRQPPGEHILSQEAAAAAKGRPGSGQDAASGGPARDVTPAKPRLDVPFCLQRVKPVWLPIKAHRFAAYRAKVLQLLPQKVLQQYIDFEKQGQYPACVKLLESATPGSLNVLSPATLAQNQPLLVETVLQLIVGYSGLCLKNGQGSTAVKLITQALDNMSLSLRDLHPGHRLVIEAYLYDTALSVCYYMPNDVSLSDRAESFFQQASERYLRLKHTNRYCKCCLRAAAVLHGQGHRSEAEYYTQQALNKLTDAPVSSLLAVCYHNLAVHTFAQQRLPDAVAHVRSYVALLRQLPKLSNAWIQVMDNTQWLVLKAQELWPQYQRDTGLRDTSHVEGTPAAWAMRP